MCLLLGPSLFMSGNSPGVSGAGLQVVLPQCTYQSRTVCDKCVSVCLLLGTSLIHAYLLHRSVCSRSFGNVIVTPPRVVFLVTSERLISGPTVGHVILTGVSGVCTAGSLSQECLDIKWTVTP